MYQEANRTLRFYIVRRISFNGKDKLKSMIESHANLNQEEFPSLEKSESDDFTWTGDRMEGLKS
jgi:hypothetical protein